MITEYIIPNILLFGGIYIFGKIAENTMWHIINNYNEIKK